MAPAEDTSCPFPTRTSTTFEVQQWMEQWHRDHQCLPTPQELERIKWDGYCFWEASGEDLQLALERWGWSDEKAKNVVHAILSERTKIQELAEPDEPMETGVYTQPDVYMESDEFKKPNESTNANAFWGKLSAKGNMLDERLF